MKLLFFFGVIMKLFIFYRGHYETFPLLLLLLLLLLDITHLFCFPLYNDSRPQFIDITITMID